MFDKMNPKTRPSKEELINIAKNNAVLKKLCAFIEAEMNAAHRIDHSTCPMAPGWNLKYKKGGRAVCTIYPGKDECGVMITLNRERLEAFRAMGKAFGKTLRNLEARTTPLNGAKWLSVNVVDEEGLAEAKKLLKLKFKL